MKFVSIAMTERQAQLVLNALFMYMFNTSPEVRGVIKRSDGAFLSELTANLQRHFPGVEPNVKMKEGL